MVRESQFTLYLLNLSFLIPVFLAMVAGVAWAGVNWKKASTPAIACVAACAVLFVFSCIFPAMHVWLPQMVMGANPGPDGITRLIWTDRIIKITSHLCTAVCLGGLIFAVFAGRAASLSKKDKERDRDDDEEDDGAISEKPTKRRSRDED